MLQIAIECTDRSATAYVVGPLSIPGLWQVMRACEELPPHMRSLRVDLQGVRLVQAGVVEALATGLRIWRESRSGTTRVDLPKSGLGVIGKAPVPGAVASPS